MLCDSSFIFGDTYSKQQRDIDSVTALGELAVKRYQYWPSGHSANPNYLFDKHHVKCPSIEDRYTSYVSPFSLVGNVLSSCSEPYFHRVGYAFLQMLHLPFYQSSNKNSLLPFTACCEVTLLHRPHSPIHLQMLPCFLLLDSSSELLSEPVVFLLHLYI